MTSPARVARLGTDVAILLLLAGSSPAGTRASEAGAAARQDAPRASTEKVTTELVLIETYVTDGSGRPIEGLTIDDFTLLVDGKKSPIASLDFRKAAPGVPVPGAVAAGGPTAVPPGGSARPAEFARRFMLFFEDGMSAPGGLTAARHAADQFLSTGLLPSDEVAIATYDRGLKILHEFTSDREASRRAIAASLRGSRRISSDYADSRAHQEELDEAMKRYQQEAAVAKMKVQANPQTRMSGGGGGGGGGRGGGGGDGAGGGGDSMAPSSANKALQDAMAGLDNQLQEVKSLAMSYAAEQVVLLRGVLRGVGALVDALAGWPGYKALVFMGDGLPENPANTYLSVILAHHPDPILANRAQQYSLSAEVDSIRRAAAARGVTIHTLQTRGLAAGTAAEMAAQYEESNTIAALALGTGGLRSSSNDFVKALAGFEASSRSYYVLGYSPSGTPDGRYHAVRVRCRKQDAQVRSREGFVRWTPEESRRHAIQAAHLIPDLFAELRLDLSAAIGPREGSEQIVDFVAHLPAGAVLFAPEAGGPVARLEIGLVIQDEHGTETFRGARSMRIARPAGDTAGPTGVDLFSRLRLPDKEQNATAVIYDDTTGTIGAARLALPATSRETARVLGLSLYSVAEKSLWVEMPFEGALEDAGGARHGSDAGDAQQKSVVGPPARTTFAVGESAVCGFRRPDPAPPAALQVVVRQDGATLRTIKVPAAGPGAPATVQVELPIESLPPGDYAVTVQETRPDGMVDRGTVPLRLRAGELPPAPGN